MSAAARLAIARHATTLVLGVAIALVFVLRARVLHTLNVNWDEFHFLSLVHAFVRDELTTRLLTFHVHLFRWVTTTSPNEARQVLHLREVMFALALVSTSCIAFIGWRLFRNARAALFAVLVGQAAAYVMHHGASARFDPLVTTFFTIAAALLVARNTGATGARRVRAFTLMAGVAFALAMLFSIKAVLLAPTLLALFAWPVIDTASTGSATRTATDAALRRVAWRGALVELVWFSVSVVVVFAALFALHVASLADAPATTAAQAAHAATRGASLADIFARQFPGDVLPNVNPLVATARWDAVFWLLFAAGGALAFTGIGAGGEARRLALKTLCFCVPLASIALYRNAFAYFYACVLPIAALLPALVVARIELRLADRRPLLAALITVVLALPAAVQAWRWFAYNFDDQVAVQIRTVDAVHAVFAEPVPYIDRCGMIGSFPKVGPFMTTWQLEDYRRAKKPIMADLIAKGAPHFLLQNVESLELAKPYSPKQPRRLLKEDFDVLADHFVPHWGPLWVAGKRVALAAQTEATFTIATSARYRVELDATASAVGVASEPKPSAITLDGAHLRDGDVVELAAGAHRATSDVAGTLTLRIATARPAPDLQPPTGRLFTTLGFRTKAPK